MRRKKKIAVIGVKGLPGFGGSARAMESLISCLKENYDFTVYAIESHAGARGDFNGYHQIVFKSNRNALLNTFFYYWKSMFHLHWVKLTQEANNGKVFQKNKKKINKNNK